MAENLPRPRYVIELFGAPSRVRRYDGNNFANSNRVFRISNAAGFAGVQSPKFGVFSRENLN